VTPPSPVRPMSPGSAPKLSDQALLGSGLDGPELERLAAVAREAAQAGAAVLRRHVGQLGEVREKGSAGNLVTAADLAAEAAVLEVLKQQTPGFPVLAEEGGQRDGEGSLRWVVDPLDGTTNFAHGYPFYGTSVGLTWEALPLLGAIAVPAFDELFWAAPGLGAWRNDQALRVSRCQQLADALLVTGFAYDRIQRQDNNYAEFAWFTHRSHGVRRAGAAAVDLAYVASGQLDGYWERGLSPWDLVAGVVLVEQAGGVVCAYDGSPLDLASGRLIACAPALRHPLIEGLAACRPLAGASYGAPELDPPAQADP
jgi:myo-inositol-1(or 4)-monophosphatase